MLIGIEGGLGSGKTVGMVRYLYKDFKLGKKIYTNFKLFKIPYKHIIIENILSNEDEQLKNCTMGIDEITVFADCRVSSSKMNRVLSYFILQSRKRSVNVYYTTQNFEMVEKRILEHTNIYVMCKKLYDKNGNEINDYRQYTILDCMNWQDPKENTIIVKIKNYYSFYDTDEIIIPPILKKGFNE